MSVIQLFWMTIFTIHFLTLMLRLQFDGVHKTEKSDVALVIFDLTLFVVSVFAIKVSSFPHL